MADEPQITLNFDGHCPDCGQRTAELPRVLPVVGDDFDWQLRDYDSFRLFMLQELAARFPERKRWTPADVEVALVEVLAAVLDQLSDMLDRTASEGYLETARRPESVRRLLKLIGYDALSLAQDLGEAPFDKAQHPSDVRTPVERFDQYWQDNPQKLKAAKVAGPRSIHTQKRIVTVDDYVTRLEEHPLVLRAHAWETWGGSWSLIQVAIIPWQRLGLDEPSDYDDEVWIATEKFHLERELFLPDKSAQQSVRSLLRPYLDAYRMAGQEVLLREAEEVGIQIFLSIKVNTDYFQSEVRRTVERTLGTGPDGFFEPGRLRFGEDLWASDLFQWLMALDGVENICLNRFKRIGDNFPDMADTGQIRLDGLEVAVCDNDPAKPERGYIRLTLNGGRKG
jgi:hypothetical protein